MAAAAKYLWLHALMMMQHELCCCFVAHAATKSASLCCEWVCMKYLRSQHTALWLQLKNTTDGLQYASTKSFLVPCIFKPVSLDPAKTILETDLDLNAYESCNMIANMGYVRL